MASQLLLCHAHSLSFPSLLPPSSSYSHHNRIFKLSSTFLHHHSPPSITLCRAMKNKQQQEVQESMQVSSPSRQLVQTVLWSAEAVYILWLFLLPYAPGDPVWAISSETINEIVGLSLNFFFILPLLNSVGIHVIEAPTLHPMTEGLFNFVIAWTLLFAPLLYTDCLRDRYKGSLDILWGCQMFLTNTFLIPYMAIRLNNGETIEKGSSKPTELRSLMINGASSVAIIGGSVCLLSLLWALIGRPDGDFGGVAERWEFLMRYLESERLAYAFIWDICLYSIFQPWLIRDNMKNVKKNYADIVDKLKFVPVVGLVAYLLSLDDNVRNEMLS